VPVQAKLAVLHETVSAIKKQCELLSLREYAARIAADRRLSELEPARI
jgi:hypothetical protein